MRCDVCDRTAPVLVDVVLVHGLLCVVCAEDAGYNVIEFELLCHAEVFRVRQTRARHGERGTESEVAACSER